MELPASTHFLRIAQNLEATIRSIREMHKAYSGIAPTKYLPELEAEEKYCRETAKGLQDLAKEKQR